MKTYLRIMINVKMLKTTKVRLKWTQQIERNTKAKKKVELEDIFENNDKDKVTENAENVTKMNLMDTG